MSTFEKCKVIYDLINHIATSESWNPNHDYDRLKGLSHIIKEKPDFSYLDITDLNIDEMKELGFRKWSTTDEMLLIPLWLFYFVDPELTVHCIDNTDVKFKDADNDTRGGLLAYGVNPKL
jgi:hypothetical protein